MHSSNDNSGGLHDRREIGRDFERLAATYFEQQGYTILERNWHAGHKEIDLIVRKGIIVVFVEVKSSSSKNFGHPAGWVDKTKQSRLTIAAQQYLIKNNLPGCDFRFDVVTFVEGKLEHFPNAFDAQE